MLQFKNQWGIFIIPNWYQQALYRPLSLTGGYGEFIIINEYESDL